MTNRIPLIVNPSANQIQELGAADNLDLGSSDIVGVSTLTANTAIINGNLTVTGTINGNIAGGGGGGGGGGSSTSGLLMSLIFGR